MGHGTNFTTNLLSHQISWESHSHEQACESYLLLSTVEMHIQPNFTN